MATSKEFYNYVMTRISCIEGISARKMMGEYVLFYKDKPFRNLCDNQFLLKPTAFVLDSMKGARRAYPYEGSKTLMVVVDDAEDTELLTEVITKMYSELPPPKKRKGI